MKCCSTTGGRPGMIIVVYTMMVPLTRSMYVDDITGGF